MIIIKSHILFYTPTPSLKRKVNKYFKDIDLKINNFKNFLREKKKESDFLIVFIFPTKVILNFF